MKQRKLFENLKWGKKYNRYIYLRGRSRVYLYGRENHEDIWREKER